MEEKNNETQEAKFNFAVSSLQRIHEILQGITSIEKAAGYKVTYPEAQLTKLKLVKQLFVQAFVLLEEGKREAIKKELYNLKTTSDINNISKYSIELDDNLNNIIIKIQASMQKRGKFFVLEKEDDELF